ncbi:hypothetical protein ARTSIC4J27_3163 [Pseudarthrobacter siccitolerans]|uniref:Uncharacterized protein n=1 Tax=Pseudarthrobacter siccitolerans TaxID=861266 RepID=A0A024H5A0_9MICC|nr:hypothetical protein ARTSIC4J27_3163 [Pseudarthrobacter siccitolerans]
MLAEESADFPESQEPGEALFATGDRASPFSLSTKEEEEMNTQENENKLQVGGVFEMEFVVAGAAQHSEFLALRQ